MKYEGSGRAGARVINDLERQVFAKVVIESNA